MRLAKIVPAIRNCVLLAILCGGCVLVAGAIAPQPPTTLLDVREHDAAEKMCHRIALRDPDRCVDEEIQIMREQEVVPR